MNAHRPLLFVGTYNHEQERTGIVVYQFDTHTGTLTPLSERDGVLNPSYLAIDPVGGFLFAVSEVADRSRSVISAYAINRDSGELTFLNSQPTLGTISAHVSLDQTRRFAMVANYGEAPSVALFPIREDGYLLPASSWETHTGEPARIVNGRQEKSHPHCIVPSPDNQVVLACDLGLDQVMVYRLALDDTQMVKHDPPTIKMTAGSGPRHLAFHRKNKLAYVVNELDSTVSVLAFEDDYTKTQIIQTLSTLPPDFDGHNQCSAIQIAPSGRFVYAGNRGHDSVAIFAVDNETGQLSWRGCVATPGKTPRSFVIDPTGAYLLVGHQDSDSIAVFKIDSETNNLKDTGIREHLPVPVCLKMAQI